MTKTATTEAKARSSSSIGTAAADWIGPANLQTGGDRLIAVLRNPELSAGQSLTEWADLMALAKFCGLWWQVAKMVQVRSLEDRIPEPVRIHFQSALHAASGHETRIRWEVDRLQAALVDVARPLILLKGSAFLLQGLSFGQNRRFSDVDLLVPITALPEVEAALRHHGWGDSERDLLHAEYFRTWLQEIAPMWHPERKVQVDIHYTIIPPKDRLPFDPQPLFDDSVPLPDGPFRVLAPVDMFLHATSNLFRTGEFTYLLRDLWDMHEMLAEFAADPAFWRTLVSRAEALRLRQTCFLALRYLDKIFELPIPSDVAEVVAGWRPNGIFLAMVDACVRRTLFPRSLDRIDAGRNRLLLLREYWPPPRLRTLCSYLFWRKRLPDFPWNGEPQQRGGKLNEDPRRRNLPQ